MKQIKVDKFLNKIIIGLGILIVLVIMILIYNIFRNGYTIELVGGDVSLYLNNIYSEPGYKAYNRSGEDVTNKVKVTNNIDITKEGNYQVVYQIGGIKRIRNVFVNYDLQGDISLTLGDNPKYILKDMALDLSDCKAYDKIDGDITSNIVIDNKVDINKTGEYEVNYSVTNSRGTSKNITRKVIVYDILYELEESIIDKKHVIKITFDETYYQKVKLPNGNFDISKEVNYTFSDNGEYILEVYDKYNNIKKITISVSKIDKVLPSGTCVLNLYDNNSKVIVKASDNQGIRGYKYHYGNNSSVILPNSEFTYNEMINNASVTIYDTSDNTVNINCEVKDLSSKYERSYTTQSGPYNYKLYIPPTLTKRNKLPLVIFLHGSGECGNDPNRINANSFPKYINEGANYDFVMVAPQLPSGKCGRAYFVPGNVKNIIDDISSKYSIDPERIIVTGFSLGANNTYTMIKDYPTLFAAALPVAGDTTYSDSLTKTDIWSFCGTLDGAHNSSKKLIERIAQYNPNSKFTSYPNWGHNITELVYKDQKVIDWIMNAKRK